MDDSLNQNLDFMSGIIGIHDPDDIIVGQVVTFDPDTVEQWMCYKCDNELDGRVLVDPDSLKVTRCQVSMPGPALLSDSFLRKDFPTRPLAFGTIFEAERTIASLHKSLFHQVAGLMLGFQFGLVERYDGDGYTGEKFVDATGQLVRCEAIRNHLNVIMTSLYAAVRHNEQYMGMKAFGADGEFKFLKRNEFQNISLREIHWKAIQLFQENSVFREHCIIAGESKDKLRNLFRELADTVEQQLRDCPDGVPRRQFLNVMVNIIDKLMSAMSAQCEKMEEATHEYVRVSSD